MPILISCDFCNKIINEGTALRYKRSWLEFLRLVPKLLSRGFYSNPSKITMTTYFICNRCRGIIRDSILTSPDVVTALRVLCRDEDMNYGHSTLSRMARREGYIEWPDNPSPMPTVSLSEPPTVSRDRY